MVTDLHTLSAVSTLLPAAAPASPEAHRVVPFLFAGPTQDGAHDISALAEEVVTHGADLPPASGGPWRHRDTWLLKRAIGGNPEDHGDLLSFLLFDSRFTIAAARLGVMHARDVLPPLTELRRNGWPVTVDGALRLAQPAGRQC
jgi:NTE family protein